MARYGKYVENNKGTSTKAKAEKHQAPREMVSISLRDNRIGCFSESGQFNHSFFYNDTTYGCLEELDLVLDQVPDNKEEICDNIKIIFVPGLIMALVTGLGDYIRLGKTSSGTVISQDNIDKFVEVHEKIQAKSFNLNIRTYEMCPVEFGQKAKAFITEECKDANAQKDGVTRTTTTVSGAVNPAIEILNKQMVDLINQGKFDEAQKVAQILATLSGTGASTPQAEEPKQETKTKDEELQEELASQME